MPSSARSRTPGSFAATTTANRSVRSPRGSSPTRRRATASSSRRRPAEPEPPAPVGPYVENALLELLASPNIRSRGWIYERYDHLVGSRTVRRPGLDAAVLRLRPSLRGLALCAGRAGPGRARGAADRRGAGRAGGGTERRLRRRRAARADRLPQLRQPGEAGDRLGARRGDRGDGAGGRGAADPGRLRERLALQRDRRPGDPAGAGGRLRRSGAGRDRRFPAAGERATSCCWRARPIRRSPGRSTRRSTASRAGRGRASTSAPSARWSSSSGDRLRSCRSRTTCPRGGPAVALAEAALWSGVGAEVDLPDDLRAWFGEGGGQAVIACARKDVARASKASRSGSWASSAATGLLEIPLPELRAGLEGTSDVRRARCLRPRPRRRAARALRSARAPAPRPGVGRHRRLRPRPPDRAARDGPGRAGLQRAEAQRPARPAGDRAHPLLDHRLGASGRTRSRSSSTDERARSRSGTTATW